MAKSKSSERVTVYMQFVDMNGEAYEESEIARFKNRRWADSFLKECEKVACNSIRFRVNESGEDEYVTNSAEDDAE